MLTEVSIINFRAVRNLSLRMTPLTVLVGPNASGKSSILRALDPTSPLRGDLWRHDESLETSFHWVDGQGPGAATGAVGWRTAGGIWSNRPYKNFQLLRFDLGELRAPTLLDEQLLLTSSGRGLANVLYSLTRAEQVELARRYCSLVPVFQDVDTGALGGGNHELRFQDRWDENLWFKPQEVSDGSLLMLAYLLIDFQKPRPSLLAIEEPERGLHPYLLRQMVELLRALTTANHGRLPIQIVLATHSAELLDYVSPEEVRFLTKDERDGSVLVEEVSTQDPNWEDAWRAHQESLGSVWLSGGLGGVPAI